jgi:hypothetical protein
MKCRIFRTALTKLLPQRQKHMEQSPWQSKRNEMKPPHGQRVIFSSASARPLLILLAPLCQPPPRPAAIPGALP